MADNFLMSGIGGTITIGETPYHIRKWTIRQAMSTVSANSSATGGVTVRHHVNSTWEGTCSIYLPDGGVDSPCEVLDRDTCVVAALVASTGHATKSYRGACIVTGLDVETDVEEGAYITGEVTFEGSGALTFAAA